MGVPVSYSMRNLWTRRATTALTVGGMAMVVFVFAAMLMLAAGVRKTLVETGSHDNVVLIRKAADSEVQSGVSREQAAIIESQPEVAIGGDGRPLLAKELMVVVTLPNRKTGELANVSVRGIGAQSFALRPQVKMVRGRTPRPGTSEIVAGANIAKRYEGGGIGETIRFATRDWTVVGVFDAGNTAYSSEVWGDAEQLMQAFNRPAFSSVLFRLRDSSRFDAYKARMESEPRLTVEARRETKYYSDQSEILAKFLSILGTSLTLVFSIGAIIGATITMYSAVANRVREIGTLRALGFRRRSILAAFLAESFVLGLAGGVVGLFFASFLRLFTVSTMNWQTFSELTFSFALTPEIAWQSVAFSCFMGVAGGVFPALRAARMNIVDALRTS